MLERAGQHIVIDRMVRRANNNGCVYCSRVYTIGIPGYISGYRGDPGTTRVSGYSVVPEYKNTQVPTRVSGDADTTRVSEYPNIGRPGYYPSIGIPFTYSSMTKTTMRTRRKDRPLSRSPTTLTPMIFFLQDVLKYRSNPENTLSYTLQVLRLPPR